VRFSDQKQINEFGTLNMRKQEIVEEVSSLKVGVVLERAALAPHGRDACGGFRERRSSSRR
jgi:hypothetical protein